MSSFPREYAESTLNRLYSKLGLPQDMVELLHSYFAAFGNFYQILTIKEGYEIFERQNKGSLTFDKFVEFSDIVRHERHYYYVLGLDELYSDMPKSEPCDRRIVHEALVDIDIEEYYNMENAQKGKPIYIPAKFELLNYADDFYCPKTKEYLSLKEFFRQKLKKSDKRAEELAEECYVVVTCEDGNPFQAIFDDFRRMRVGIPNIHLDEFAALFQDFFNNTRLSFNRGFTPNELHRQLGESHAVRSIALGQNLKDMIRNGDVDVSELTLSLMNSDIPFDLREQLMKGAAKELNAPSQKIGRNQPCPCGSGKKYKRCCGK